MFLFFVIPAKAGIQKTTKPNIRSLVSKAKNGFYPWMPAFAGMTRMSPTFALDARLRGHDEDVPHVIFPITS